MLARLLFLSTALIAGAVSAAAEVVPRQTPVAGAVVAVKIGEEASFVEDPRWRGVDVSQQVRTGDVLRTNALGQLAILFADQTQIRVGRNTTLTVKQLVPGGDSRFGLEAGSIWARAARGGTAVTVETPAAAAAIRGTDWSMTVGPDGRTSLIVMEGVVELANAQGSVRVAEGEAAVAAIGEAPTKTVVVSPNDREQMLYYLQLRDAFTLMPPSPLPSREQRSERARIDAIPPEARSVEDRVTRAELAFSYDGREAARAAVAAARAANPDVRLGARLDMVEAMLAASEGRDAEAARRFEAAARNLDPQRREIAAFGAYFARALADPERAEALPSAITGPYAAIAAAYAAGFLKDTRAAIALVAAAEKRWPDEAFLPAARAQLSMLIDDREQMRAAYERALALDPENPTGLQARAYYRSGYESDLEGALGDLRTALAAAPGDASLWNTYALLQSEREANLEAMDAIERAIALDPEDPLFHANRALLLMEDNRLDAAKAEIDRAFALDPSFDVAYVALGRWHLQKGDMPAAIEALLQGSTANPAYSQALLLLSAAYYQNGDIDPALQALDNADRLDPNDPITSIQRTRVAIDRYEADVAIEAARESLRRTRARGGVYASLGASRDAGSVLSEAFRFAGLNAWGRYYGNVVFDPFVAGGYFDASVDGNVDPFTSELDYSSIRPEPVGTAADFSNMVQGLLLDPLAIASTQRRTQMIRAPFFEVELGGGFVSGDAKGWTATAEINAFANKPLPFSLYADVQARGLDDDRSDIDEERLTGTVILGGTPSLSDRFVAFGVANDATIPGPGSFIALPTGNRDGAAYTGGFGWSHSFGHRNVLNAAVLATTGQTDFNYVPGLSFSTTEEAFTGSVQHLIGVGDVTFRYGFEAGSARTRLDFPLFGFTDTTDTTFARANADVLYEATPDLTFEAGLVGSWYDDGSDDRFEPAPRVGVAWSMFEGHWLRAFAMREVEPASALTLAPIGVLGLRPDEQALGAGAVGDTVGLRWDAEWSERFFTSLDYQHSWYDPFTVTNPLDPSVGFAIPDGSIDRVSLTGNLWLGNGFGAFATAAYAHTDDGNGNAIPYVPETSARAGVTWTHPSRIRATLAGTWIGDRAADLAGTEIDGAFTLDALLHYEPLDRRVVFDLGVYNILDEDFEVAPGTTGWGRTVVGSMSVRF